VRHRYQGIAGNGEEFILIPAVETDMERLTGADMTMMIT